MDKKVLEQLIKENPDEAVLYQIAVLLKDLNDKYDLNLKELAEGNSEVLSTLKTLIDKEYPTNVKAEVSNFPVFPDKVEVKNLNDINVPKTININEPDWLKNLQSKEAPMILKVLDLIRKNGLEITTKGDPRKPVPVRLSDGDKFYNAILTAVSGGGSPFRLPNGKASDANLNEDGLLKTIDPVANSLVPSEYDYIDLSYTDGDLTQAVFKTGGSTGTTVSTLTLAYTDGSLTSVTKS